jgi:uncharacterized protein YbjT (DUF2867 family)
MNNSLGQIQVGNLPTAIVLGGSGLIGGLLLRRLLDSGDYAKIVAISRQRLPLAHSRLENVVDDMANLREIIQVHAPTDVFCCLGTTMKVAGSEQKFRYVDYELPVIAAESARKSGARHFLVVSAIGANARSHFFYNRVKGELETELKRLGFPFLTIMQPSLLLGERDEQRVLEKISGQIFGFLKPVMVGGLANIAPVEAESVANKMYEEAKNVRSGRRDKKIVTIQSKEMQ